jgi:type IV pilus assembly protein PilQ
MTKRTQGRRVLWAAGLLAAGLCLPVFGQSDDPGTFSSFSSEGGEDAPMIDSFEVTDADVRSVFKMLSKHSGVDIVLSDDVSGAVTLRLTGKTWRDIFMIVCRIAQLEPMKEENYFYVMTKEEFEAQLLANAANDDAEDRMAPLERHIITLSNTTASAMMTPIATLLSSRGKITVVEHNNSLIVFDTKENIKQIRGMVEKLDIETAQISISCKIIEVNSGEAQNMGVHWGFVSPTTSLSLSHLDAPGTTGGAEVAAGAIEKLTYGILTPERFSVALEYLFEDNRGEVVAQPSITTLDNRQARIFTGSQVPVVHLDEARNSVVTMVDAGTELTVTPHVTGEGRVMLDLNPKKKSYYFGENGQPVINEQSAQTNVVVNDGETVVIAGLTSNETQDADAGIPFLKDIPLIGNLFKRSKKSRVNKDLIIFVTPHIIERKLGTVGADITAGVVPAVTP